MSKIKYYDDPDFELFEKTPEFYYAKDKDSNEYCVMSDGKLNPVEKGTIHLNWYYASIGEIKQYIELKRKFKLESAKKIKNVSYNNVKSAPKILPPDIDGFTTYFERINHGLELTDIMFKETNIIITDSTDYFDDDSERNEYYIIEANNYLELISKLEKEYKPISIEDLNPDTKTYFDYFINNNLKKIFLLVLSVIGYDKNIKDEYQKYIRGDKLINLLCGDVIKYKKNYYSKGM